MMIRKNKYKNKFFILLMTILSLSILIQVNIFIDTEMDRSDLLRINFNLNSSESWNNLTFIHITDLNWSSASTFDWCSGSGTWSNPYLIENMILNASESPNGVGIFIENSTNVYFKIQNTTIFGASDGLKLENSNNGMIINNILLNNMNSGISLLNSNNNTLSKNIMKNEGTNFQNTGIYLGFYCNDNNIMENTIIDNDLYGINIEDYCQGNNIINNTIANIATSQQDYGLRLDNDCNHNNISLNKFEALTYGIMLVTSDSNSVERNIIKDMTVGMYMLIAHQNKIINNIISDGSTGITMSACDNGEFARNFINNTGNQAIRIYINCDNNEFYDNIIKDNANLGIELLDPSDINNKFYRNSFISNGLHAYDNGTNSLWNNTAIGNYWDNYSGLDLNDDHIGDIPHALSGAANASDDLPIFDNLAPSVIINSPIPGNYSSDAPTFNIFVNETYLHSIWYEISGKRYYFTKNGTINQVAWNDLSNGGVTITFYARDITWKVGSSTVDIVKDTSQPSDDPSPEDPNGGTPPPPVDFMPLIIAISIIISAIIILGIIMRVRRGGISKLRTLSETELSEAQYFKDITSILTILAIDINTGLCLSKIALHEGIGLDEHLFTGFISAIGSFKYEIAKQMGLGVREGRGDNIIEYNEFTITLMDGEYLRLGLVSHSSLGNLIKMRANQVLRDYEMKHANDLKEFDGEIHIFKDFKKIIENGLDLHLNQKFIINPKNLNKSNLSETFEELLSKFSSTSEGFYLAEIIQPIIKNLGVSEEMAYFMIYDAYKKQVLIQST